VAKTLHYVDLNFPLELGLYKLSISGSPMCWLTLTDYPKLNVNYALYTPGSTPAGQVGAVQINGPCDAGDHNITLTSGLIAGVIHSDVGGTNAGLYPIAP